MAVYVPIGPDKKWFQDEDKEFLFWLKDADGNDVDGINAGYVLKWSVSDDEDTDATSRFVLDITIGDYTEGEGDPNPGTLHANAGGSVTVPAATSADMPADTYHHEVWNVASGQRAVLAYGPVTLRASNYRGS